MPGKQAVLDFPIRKTRACRNKTKVLDEVSSSKGSPNTRSRRSVSLRVRSSSPDESPKKDILAHPNLERTPTKRRIPKDYDQENCCSPPKRSPTQVKSENNGDSKVHGTRFSAKKILGEHNEETKINKKVVIPLSPLRVVEKNESPFKSPFKHTSLNVASCSRDILKPRQLNLGNNSDNLNEITTRSRSPFKSPFLKTVLNPVSSPQICSKRLTFQSPSKSVDKHPDLRSPSKSPVRLRECSPAKPVKSLDFNIPSSPLLKRLDFGSPRRSPRKRNTDVQTPQKSPRKLSLSPTSPKRAPLDFNLEDNGLRRSPRKLPMSPLKYQSPSSLVSKLTLSSPSSGRKAVSVGLFKPNVTAYRAMRQSLNTGTPTTLVCRDEQIKVMKDFLTAHLKKSKAGSLYVSGAPGTGKTACLHSLLAEMEDKRIKKMFLNCMTLRTSASIYGQIVTDLGQQVQRTEKENIKVIEKMLSSSKHPILIVLDEIDQLDSKNQEVLYSIFEWPSLKNSKLVLVGIANALDLTDRVLPRLQARPTFKPKLLHFPPYSRAEIVKILNQRIQEAGLNDIQIIRPTAVQFLAGKVAGVAGDVRKALDVCRRAVELCEIQARRQSVLKPSNGSPRKSPRKSPKKPDTTVKMVEIPQVMAIFNEVYGSRVISAVQNAPDSFTLQQKIVICCLLLFLRHAKSKDVTLGKFHEVYTRVCRKRSIPNMDQSEFVSLCTLLESRGMLQVKRSKEIRSSKIVLRLNPEEAEQALGDRTLLAAVLEDKESLGNLCKK